jgi:hypothetical protein
MTSPLNRSSALGDADVYPIWPEPTPLPEGLPPVLSFNLALLPEPLRDWVSDISERMQAPADFIAATAMVAAGAVIGRKVGIRPETNTDWTEVPNLWGCIVGRPGVLKSPCMKAAMAPLYRLEAMAREEHRAALDSYKAGSVMREMQAGALKEAMKERLKLDPKADLSDLAALPEEEPKGVRYIANDAGYQALAELLRNSATNGILAFRDELMSLVKALEDEGRVEDRGFYLTGWNGADPYTSDRIGRGADLHIPSVTISLFGSTQPGKIQATVARALAGGEGDDGLIQRFGMLVWPDLDPNWREVDREPDAHSKRVAFQAFERLAHLTPDVVGAVVDDYHPDHAYLRFTPEAREEFSKWRRSLEGRLRSGELHPAMESHLAKYRKLVPALALIYHIVGGGYGPVPLPALLAACAWAEYLESHAARVYGVALDDSAAGARLILKRILAGKLESPFRVRDLHQRGWAGLTDRDAVSRAIDRLEAHNFIRVKEEETGGRPSVVATINPRVAGMKRKASSSASRP